MNLSKLVTDLKRDEGLKLKPYKCTADKLTIGYGRNLDDVGISEVEAETMLINDIHNVINDLDMYIPWWKSLSEDRQRAMINLGFNLGLPRLMGFKKMLKALREGDFDRAAKEALDSKWAIQVKSRANRIAKLIEEGE